MGHLEFSEMWILVQLRRFRREWKKQDKKIEEARQGMIQAEFSLILQENAGV